MRMMDPLEVKKQELTTTDPVYYCATQPEKVKLGKLRLHFLLFPYLRMDTSHVSALLSLSFLHYHYQVRMARNGGCC
jgi:hypothetical protein